MGYSDRIASLLKSKEPIQDTVYEAPREQFVHQFSAVNSGVSEQDGLATLTFKSIGYTQYAEQLELMRDAMFQDKPTEFSRISEKPFNGQQVLEKLQKELETLKTELPEMQTENYQILTNLNNKLNELIANRQPIDDIGEQIFNQYKKTHANVEFKTNPEPFVNVHLGTKNDVELILDVKDLDTSAYEKRNIQSPFSGKASSATAETSGDIGAQITAEPVQEDISIPEPDTNPGFQEMTHLEEPSVNEYPDLMH